MPIGIGGETRKLALIRFMETRRLSCYVSFPPVTQTSNSIQFNSFIHPSILLLFAILYLPTYLPILMLECLPAPFFLSCQLTDF